MKAASGPLAADFWLCPTWQKEQGTLWGIVNKAPSPSTRAHPHDLFSSATAQRSLRREWGSNDPEVLTLARSDPLVEAEVQDSCGNLSHGQAEGGSDGETKGVSVHVASSSALENRVLCGFDNCMHSRAKSRGQLCLSH